MIIKEFPSRLFFLVSGALAMVLSSCNEETDTPPEPKQASQEIRFGVYTADKASKVVEKFAPTLKQLEAAVSEKLDRPIKIRLKVSSDYEKCIEALVSGEIQLSRLGPSPYITAKGKNPKLDLLTMESKGGKKTFNGIIATHQNSEITELAQLKGKSFAFGDPLSTIGRYLSQAELLKAGLTGADLSKFEFLGRHDTVGMAVVAGDYTAGALKESTYKDLVANGHPLKILMKFDNVTKPWVAHPSVDSEVREALRGALLEMDGGVSKDGFLTASDSDYDRVRDAMALVEKF